MGGKEEGWPLAIGGIEFFLYGKGEGLLGGVKNVEYGGGDIILSGVKKSEKWLM